MKITFAKHKWKNMKKMNKVRHIFIKKKIRKKKHSLLANTLLMQITFLYILYN